MSLPPDMVSKAFWPTTFFSRTWGEHPTEGPGILDHLYRLRSAESDRIASGVSPAMKSSRGLFESRFDLFADPHPGLGKLKAFIGQTVQAAVAHVNGGQVEPRRLRVAVTDSWFHITNDGGFHDAHFHGGCSWCGIYYLQIGETGSRADGGAPNGANRFYSPLHVGGGHKDYGSQYLDFNFTDVPARDGLLILFPSYLMHSGLPYRGQHDRVVVSFNAQVTLA